MDDGEFTREGIKEIRKGIAPGEKVTPLQEEMLAWLGIDWADVRAKVGKKRYVRTVQEKINGKLLALARKGKA